MRMALTLTIALLLTPAAHAAGNVSISMTPYPFTVTTGMVCQSVADLTAALDSIESGGNTPDPTCEILDGSEAIDATATPVERYTNGDIDGVITKYSAPGLPDVYGIMQREPAPTSSVPHPSSDDVHI